MSTSTDKRRTPKDATIPVTCKITRAHVAVAKCGKPADCVVAQALRATFGDLLQAAEVGTSITKIITPTEIIRYGTPAILRSAIRTYDKTGNWNLGVGEFTLLVPAPTSKLGGRPNRWDKHRHTVKRSGRDMFKARALPTRRVIRAERFQTI